MHMFSQKWTWLWEVWNEQWRFWKLLPCFAFKLGPLLNAALDCCSRALRITFFEDEISASWLSPWLSVDSMQVLISSVQSVFRCTSCPVTQTHSINCLALDTFLPLKITERSFYYVWFSDGLVCSSATGRLTFGLSWVVEKRMKHWLLSDM